MIIAIAGGTSAGLGRSIVTALLNCEHEFTPVILSRSSKRPLWLRYLSVEIRTVDYSSEASLFEKLRGVHTVGPPFSSNQMFLRSSLQVLCTLLAVDGTWASAQLALLSAALAAGVRRFAPAEWGCGLETAAHVDVLAPQLEVRAACREAKRTHPGFEIAFFTLGLFMNYLGYGARDEAGALNGRPGADEDWVFVWDVKNMKARIPLSPEGHVPRISLMEIGDVGSFIAAACALEAGSWQEDFSMVGQTLCVDEVISIVEEVRGEKMDVERVPFEKVVAEERSQTVVYPNKFWGQLETVLARDEVGESWVKPVLNEKCPGVSPMQVQEYVRKFWR